LATIKEKLDSTANFSISTNFFLVRLRTPRLFQDTGANVTDPFTEVDTISAIYSANIVHSYFSKGVFYQELEGTIDPPVEISKFLKDIELEEEQNARKATFNAATTTAINSSLIPTTAIRSDPLASPITIPGVSNSIKDNSGNIIQPGNSIGLTASQIAGTTSAFSLPGIDTNTVNTIGSSTFGLSSIPGLPSTSSLNNILQTSILKAAQGKK